MKDRKMCLGEELNPDELFDDLESGVRLLYLAKSIQLTKCGLMKDADFREKVEHVIDFFCFYHQTLFRYKPDITLVLPIMSGVAHCVERVISASPVLASAVPVKVQICIDRWFWPTDVGHLRPSHLHCLFRLPKRGITTGNRLIPFVILRFAYFVKTNQLL